MTEFTVSDSSNAAERSVGCATATRRHGISGSALCGRRGRAVSRMRRGVRPGNNFDSINRCGIGTAERRGGSGVGHRSVASAESVTSRRRCVTPTARPRRPCRTVRSPRRVLAEASRFRASTGRRADAPFQNGRAPSAAPRRS